MEFLPNLLEALLLAVVVAKDVNRVILSQPAMKKTDIAPAIQCTLFTGIHRTLKQECD